MASLKQTLLRSITQYYFDSGDFNGTPFAALASTGARWMRAVRALVREGNVSVVFGDMRPNAHIKAFPSEPIDVQLSKLTSEHLQLQAGLRLSDRSPSGSVIGPTDYADRPFSRRLALGAAQPDFESFDLSVLEYYRNDPRYVYSNDDISGSISYSDNESVPLQAGDSVVLQTFGFSYDEELNRAVAVFIRYLSDLSPEHQQIWKAKTLTGTYYLHPDYGRSTLGEWPEGISIFDAFGLEAHHINVMCRLMGRPPLFRREYREDQKPREFSRSSSVRR